MVSLELAVKTLELALFIAGVALLWRFEVRPASRANRPVALLPRWDITPLDFVFFFWFVFMGAFIGQFGTLQLLKFFPGTNSEIRMIVAGAGLQLGLLAGCLCFRLRSAAKQAETKWQRLAVNPFAAGGAAFAMSMPLLSVIGFGWQYVLKTLHVEAPRQELFDLFSNVSSPRWMAILMILAVVVAPITEELIFRAGIFRFARGRLPRTLALLVPAVLFAAPHANLASFPQLVTLGVVFSLAYERTGDIRVSMIAHGMFNLNSVIVLVAGLGTDT